MSQYTTGTSACRRAISGLAAVAMAGTLLAVLPVIPGFVRAVTTPGGVVAAPGVFDRLYAYAWFVTFGVSFVAYLALMRSSVILSEAKEP